jgi:hypothetical protein
LSGENGQIRGSGGIVKALDKGNGAGAFANVGILGGEVWIAAWDFMVYEVIDTTERGRSFKKKAGQRRELAGLNCRAEIRSRGRNEDAEMGSSRSAKLG